MLWILLSYLLNVVAGVAASFVNLPSFDGLGLQIFHIVFAVLLIVGGSIGTIFTALKQRHSVIVAAIILAAAWGMYGAALILIVPFDASIVVGIAIILLSMFYLSRVSEYYGPGGWGFLAGFRKRPEKKLDN